MNDDTQVQNLASLLADNKKDEAAAVIKGVFNTDLTTKEEGAIYASVTATYLDTVNAIDEEYIAALEEMRDLLKSAKGTGDKVKAAQIHNDLMSQ